MNLVIEIGELVGKISITNNLSSNPTLRRENRIRTIHSSLAIEQNTLTLEQVSDVMDGKRILGPPSEIREVKNAYEAYEYMQKLNPYSIKDLLIGHKILMMDLVKEAGSFRNKGVGVYAGDYLIHAGTPPQYVPQLMKELFDWLKTSKFHPLVKSCVFHYEFEFIHPFSDGNGRMGRMWHTLLLSKWKDFFAWLPVETLIHERQNDYYQAINNSNTNGESTIFVEFMLGTIRDALFELINSENRNNVGINVGVNVGIKNNNLEDKLFSIISSNPELTAKELSIAVSLTQRQVERIISKLKEKGKIERVGAKKNGYWKINRDS